MTNNHNKRSESLEALVSNKYFYPLVLTFGYSAAFVSLLDPILNSYRRGDFLVSTVYTVFFVFVLFLGYILRPKNVRIEPPTKEVFQGVGRLSSHDAWPRTETSRLCEAIEESIEKPIILVGSSGVGKSVLLETQVVPSLREKGWEIISFSTYDSFQAQVLETLSRKFPNLSQEQLLSEDPTVGGIDSNTRLLLIFDQFEQFLSANSRNVGETKKAREWFRAFLENSANFSNIRHVIVVRKEWYYDLRFLKEFVPSPINSFHLSGLRIDENKSDMLMISRRIQEATKNTEAAKAVLKSLMQNHEILPVEVQMVGLMLENKTREVGEIDSECYLNDLGGRDGLIQRYFHAYLDSSPDPDISLKVLFALSVKTVLRTQHSASQIADVVHESQADVSECLSFFVKQGLVLTTNAGRHELAHDYLAEKFHDLSGAELDPVQRDNITFFWDEITKSSDPLQITRPKRGTRRKLVFSDYFMIFLSVLLLVRLTGPIYGVDWGWFNLLDKYQIQKMNIDIHYIPVFVSHLAWSIYVTLFYRRFFSHLNESEFGRLFSKFTVVTCTACVLTATFLPYFWLLSIGVGGVAIGLKVCQLSRTPGLGKISVAHFKSMGIKATINSVIVILFGLVLITYVHSTTFSDSLVQQFDVVAILLAMVMTYYMIFVTPNHITRNATSKMMGLYDRGRVRSQRLKF